MRRAALFVLGIAACGAPPPKPSAVPVIGDWTFDVDATASPVVRITAVFRATQSTHFVLGVTPKSVELEQTGAWTPVEPKAELTLPCGERCTVRYVIDFADAPAGWGESVASGSKGRKGYLSPSWVWLLHPEPITYANIALTMHGKRFVSGVRDRMRSMDFGEGSLAAFGELRTKTVTLSSARLDMAILGDDSIAMGDDAVAGWVERSAKTVSLLWGRFPVDRAAVFVCPVAGRDDVVFGQALSLGGPAIKTFMGTEMKASDIPTDWVLVHEMVHLGFPTFLGEGRWLGEGVATYYEPILRSRAGHLEAKKMWTWFGEQMPRAATRGKHPLEGRGDIDAIYWGGAFFMLQADVAIRRETSGRKSMDDAMRAIFAKDGDATHVWTVADVLRVGDESTGTHVLSALHDAQAVRGDEVDPRRDLAALGVSEKGISDAPLAWIRDAIAK